MHNCAYGTVVPMGMEIPDGPRLVSLVKSSNPYQEIVGMP